MENKQLTVGFKLVQISTEQFAIIEDAFKKDDKVIVNSTLRFAADKPNKLIIVIVAIRFEQKKNPFLICEAACHFIINASAWDEFKSVDSEIITIPKGFITHLTVLTIGTVRGILHAKTEGTNFNGFVLPTLNVADMIKDDVFFD